MATPAIFRRTAAALAAITCILTAGACGSSNDPAQADGPAVVVKHSRGETAIQGTPKRIVTFGDQWTDAVQALGITPVGFVSTNAAMNGGKLAPWTTPALKESKAISMGGKVDEQVAQLNPDLILVPGFAIDDATYEKLKGLAPVIPALTKSQIDPWAGQVTQLGRVLHKETEASQVISGVNNKIKAVADELPGLKGKKYIFCWLGGPSMLMVLADPKDGASSLFGQLGMALPQNIIDEAKGAGRLQLSQERMGDLKSDLLIAATPPGGEENYRKTPGFAALPAVQRGSQLFVDMVVTGGINEPTPLSVPYVLDKIKPALVSAAK